MTLSTSHTQPTIHQLPNFLIDQIKAGEVVERPSQAIKEIVENSIDAGADRITLEIKDNGLELISCQDNGAGIRFDQLPIAFKRHATSKITRYEDLFKLDTFGFRGEALASVAAISRLSCYSKPHQEDQQGGKIAYAGGEQVEYFENEALSPGTTLSIENLFYNTPARLKFIRSKQAEKNAINKILNSFLFANYAISFSIKWDEQEAKLYPACGTQKERIEQIFSKKKNNQVLDFTIEHENYRVHGYYSLEANKGTQGKYQYLFVNNRYFQDKSIHQIILRSLEYLWGPGMSGHYCLFIDAPKEQVDVNVHPSKTFIKFQKPSLVHSLVGAGLRQNKTSEDYHYQRPEASGEEASTEELPLNLPKSPALQRGSFSGSTHLTGTPESSFNLFFLNGEYIIFRHEEKNHILNLTKLLTLYFGQYEDSEAHRPQALLVAIPLPHEKENKKLWEQLNQSSFHIEAVPTADMETIQLVRAVPQWLIDLGVRPFLKLFIAYKQDRLTFNPEERGILKEAHLAKMISQLGEVPKDILKEISTEMIEAWLNN